MLTHHIQEPAHTGQYIHRLTNNSDHVNKAIIHSLHASATTLCTAETNLDAEINNIFNYFQANG